MAEPVLVVHGVANRDPQAFGQQVEQLNRKLGPQWNLIPVFWGDLGGKSDDILDSLPIMPGHKVRGVGAIPPELLESLFAKQGLDSSAPLVRSNDERQEVILRGAEDVAASAPHAVRSEPETRAIREAVEEEIPQTRYLQHIEDPDVLEVVGRILGQAASAQTTTAQARGLGGEHSGAGGGLVRGNEKSVDGFETRGVFDDLKNLSKSLLVSLDELVGQAVGSILGDANQRLRGAIADPFVRFFGDIFAYQRNQDAIQARLWQAIKQHAPGYGTEHQPIHVIAHSLGGVVCFDTAVQATPPLWIKSFVTFGSQSAFFHILDRRQRLAVYVQDQPVTLPATIGQWINLWDTMDFLAFTAGKVFRLHDGRAPKDIKVENPMSLLVAEKGWTHSIYWQTEELMAALEEASIGGE